MNVCVIAPHADDETLGCGGSLFRHKAVGDELNWILVTRAWEWDPLFTYPQIAAFEQQIERVQHAYDARLHRLNFQTCKLSSENFGDLVGWLAPKLTVIKPDILYLPSPADAHSDHRYVYEAALSATKRMFGIKIILA